MVVIAIEKEILLVTMFRFALNTLIINMHATIKELGTT
jgi:hypothetical protein